MDNFNLTAEDRTRLATLLDTAEWASALKVLDGLLKVHRDVCFSHYKMENVRFSQGAINALQTFKLNLKAASLPPDVAAETHPDLMNAFMNPLPKSDANDY